MDLRLSPEEQAFRAELRGFIRDNLPAEIARAHEGGPRRRASRTSSPGSAS